MPSRLRLSRFEHGPIGRNGPHLMEVSSSGDRVEPGFGRPSSALRAISFAPGEAGPTSLVRGLPCAGRRIPQEVSCRGPDGNGSGSSWPGCLTSSKAVTSGEADQQPTAEGADDHHPDSPPSVAAPSAGRRPDLLGQLVYPLLAEPVDCHGSAVFGLGTAAGRFVPVAFVGLTGLRSGGGAGHPLPRCLHHASGPRSSTGWSPHRAALPGAPVASRSRASS
jgi:hypothetical protein